MYCHGCLQLSPCVLNDVIAIFITCINRINSSQFSGTFEFRFLEFPLLLFFIFELLFQFLIKRQATCDQDVMLFGFSSVTPKTTKILLEESR